MKEKEPSEEASGEEFGDDNKQIEIIRDKQGNIVGLIDLIKGTVE